MQQTHLVLAFAGLALLLGVGTAAGSGFTCGDGEEVYYDKLCNGVDDCTDGSDEAASLCDTTYPGNFSVGDKLVARVQFEWALHAINFDLCNNSNCSRLYVYGSSSSRRLAYFGSVGCNRHGGFCSKMYNSGYGGQGHFLTGEQAFGLERRADGLSVWQHGHPGDNIWIPAPQDFDRLRITPDTWYHDMPVALSRDVGGCNEQEFQCSDGQCVSLVYKCDGVADCADGADEDPAACELASVNLTVDSLAVARVQYRAEHGALIFLLCGDTGCNHLRRARCGSQGGFWGGYRMDDCSLQGSFCNGGAGSSCFPEESFPPGELVFEIQLKGAWPSGDFQSVEIRLRGESRFSGGDTVKKGNTRLQIRPANWTSAMPVNYTAIPLTTTAAPTTTTTLPTTTTTTPATAPPTDPPTTATPRRTTTAAPWRTTPASRSTPSSPTTRSPPPAWPPQPAPLVCEPRFAYLLLPAAGDCRGYTVCLAGSGRLARCDAPLLFSYALQACVWPGTPAAEPCAS